MTGSVTYLFSIILYVVQPSCRFKNSCSDRTAHPNVPPPMAALSMSPESNMTARNWQPTACSPQLVGAGGNAWDYNDPPIHPSLFGHNAEDPIASPHEHLRLLPGIQPHCAHFREHWSTWRITFFVAMGTCMHGCGVPNVYIGQTGKSLDHRSKKHRRALVSGNVVNQQWQSMLAMRCIIDCMGYCQRCGLPCSCTSTRGAPYMQVVVAHPNCMSAMGPCATVLALPWIPPHLLKLCASRDLLDMCMYIYHPLLL